MIQKKLYPVEDVIDFIQQGKKLVLSGDEKLLDLLPKGSWIGGTIPYFMSEEGGTNCHDKIFVDDFTDIATNIKIKSFTKSNINQITQHGFNNGFIFLILPFSKPIVLDFALNSLQYPDIFKNPLIGYVAGVDLDVAGLIDAQVYNGDDSTKSDTDGVVMYVELPPNQIARVEIINIFNQNPKSEEITFIKDSFIQSDCLINGKPGNIFDFLNEIDYDNRLPIITKCAGAYINRDRQIMDSNTRSVIFNAPLFSGDTYKLATPIYNYQQTFIEQIPPNTSDVVFSCNCVSNYANGNLEGKKLSLFGPMPYGEIAFQLLNMTQTYLAIDEI